MPDKQVVFVTGTDTDAGKTVTSCGLLEKARQEGLSTLAIKPVASGCTMTPEGLRNADALALSSAMTVSLAYEQVNPFAFEPAIAPHIAAEEAGVRVTSEQLVIACQQTLVAGNASFALIEGAGGWRVPLSGDGQMCLSDVAKQLNIPVILVVGMKLGCINHARLSAEAIINDGMMLAGWIANQIDPAMERVEENLCILQKIIPGHFFGYVPFLSSPTPEQVAKSLSLKGWLDEMQTLETSQIEMAVSC